MELLDFLYAFGIGIAFVAGGLSVVVVSVNYVAKMRFEVDEKIIDQNKVVEKRLKAYVFNTGRIADSLEKLADK
jgi:hypothetical protein